MTFDQVVIAELNREQLEEVNALETKLGVTLVAYEDSSRKTASNSDHS